MSLTRVDRETGEVVVLFDKAQARVLTAKIRDARSVNAQEGTPREFVDATGWLTARL